MLYYSFRETPLRVKNGRIADAQKIGETLADIKKSHAGRLRPEYVWQRARDDGAKNPLHQHFEWDIQKAAEQQWNDTARRIIRLVCVREEEDEEPHYAFVSITTEDDTAAYFSRRDILDSETLQRLVLEQADRDLAAWQRRYGELVDLCQDVQRIRQALQQRRNANGDANHQSDKVDPTALSVAGRSTPVQSKAPRSRRSVSGRGGAQPGSA